MIELLRTEDCIGCDKCVDACPTNVFDRTASGIP
ncbi:4Fe-4S binding protein, partial [Nocardia cyriacigeorgica]